MSDSDVGVDAALARFGLPSTGLHRDAIILRLREELRREQEGEGDQFLMRLHCAQLFSIGRVEDTLVIWEAKSFCFDTMLGIDVQFLCGAGLSQTKEYLRGISTKIATDALEYITRCEASGDFAGYTVEKILQQVRAFYKIA